MIRKVLAGAVLVLGGAALAAVWVWGLVVESPPASWATRSPVEFQVEAGDLGYTHETVLMSGREGAISYRANAGHQRVGRWSAERLPSDAEITEAHYFSVIEHKSAVLLSASCACGSILGGVTKAEQRTLTEFGRPVGRLRLVPPATLQAGHRAATRPHRPGLRTEHGRDRRGAGPGIPAHA